MWNNLTCAYCSTASGSTTTKQPLIPEVYAGDPSTLSAEAATGRVQVRWGDLGFFVHRRSGKAMWLWWFLVLIPKMSQGSPPGAKLPQIFWDETQQKWGFWTSLDNSCEVSYECKKQPHHLGVLSWDVTNIGYIESGTKDVSINPSWRRSPMSPQKAHKMHWYSHGLYKSMETLPSSRVNDLGAQVLEKNAGSLVVRVAQRVSHPRPFKRMVL